MNQVNEFPGGVGIITVQHGHGQGYVALPIEAPDGSLPIVDSAVIGQIFRETRTDESLKSAYMSESSEPPAVPPGNEECFARDRESGRSGGRGARAF